MLRLPNLIRCIGAGCSRRACSSSYDRGFVEHREAVVEEHKRRLVELELSAERQCGNFYVPGEIEDRHWKHLLSLRTAKERLAYYRYLKLGELKRTRKSRQRVRHEEDRQSRLRLLNANRDDAQYGIGKNFLFLKITPRRMNEFYNARLVHAISFGQKVVYDMDYEDLMDKADVANTAKQLTLAYASLKRDRDPFHLHFCNLRTGGLMEEQLMGHMPQMRRPGCLLMATSASYLDCFPKERIVYLVPDCGIPLAYDFNDVYVIGACMDRNRKIYTNRMMLAKAKREGVRMAEFPVSQHLRWKTQNRCLTLDRTMKILITMKNTEDWRKALEHVPTSMAYRKDGLADKSPHRSSSGQARSEAARRPA